MTGMVVFEHEEDDDLGEDVIDGMGDDMASAVADGWESEHVFDASIENPPHPHLNWDDDEDDD